jgi:hypothetical protein
VRLEAVDDHVLLIRPEMMRRASGVHDGEQPPATGGSGEQQSELRADPLYTGSSDSGGVVPS